MNNTKKKPDSTRKKDESKKSPGSDSGRQETPRKHEDAPGRNPAPKRPTVDEPPRGKGGRDNDSDDERENG
jgi:hypothetical protein